MTVKVTEGMPGFISALKIVSIVSELSDDDIDEALKHLSLSGSTYGTLWGAGNPGPSYKALRLLEFLGHILQFAAKIRADDNFPIAVRASLIRLSQEAKP